MKHMINYTFMGVVFLSAFCDVLQAGSLEPSGPPAPSMYTLQDIYLAITGDSNVVNTSSGSAVASDIRSGKKAWVKGLEITGTAQTNTSAVARTGQTHVYYSGDDGFYQAGIAWPSPRFTDNNDGTITDLLTGLMWISAPHSLPGDIGVTNWWAAINYCESLEYAGYSDWRLPNIRELHSFFDYGRAGLPIEYGFSGLTSMTNTYWSSTTANYGRGGNRWYVDLVWGFVNSYFTDDNRCATLPVRHP